MTFIQAVQRHWGGMTQKERLELLTQLTASVPTDFVGLSLAAVAQIPDADDLPADICGRLILACNENGLSVAEHSRVSQGIQDWLFSS